MTEANRLRAPSDSRFTQWVNPAVYYGSHASGLSHQYTSALLRLELSTGWWCSGFEIAPELDQQFARDGDDADAAHTAAAVSEPGLL